MRDRGLLPDGRTPVERAEVDRSGSCPRSRSGSSDRTARSAAMSCSTSWSALGFDGLGPHRAPGGGGGEVELAAGPPAGVSAVGRRAGDVGPVGLGPRPDDRRPARRICSARGWRGRRFRVVIPAWDRTMPTVIGCLDRAMRAFGGVPTYWLTDNERTVTIEHVAGIAVRHPLIVAGRPPLRGHGRDVRAGGPGVQGRCRSDGADRQGRPGPDRHQPAATTTQSGPSSSTRATRSWSKVNGREHRVTRRAPVEMLAEEQATAAPAARRGVHGGVR